MIVGLCRIHLHLPGNGSLKEKRSRLKPLLNGLRKEFNLAAAEVDDNDLWQSAVIAIVTVANDAAYTHALLERAVHWIETNRPDLQVVDWEIELV
ncbi:MAG: DUF503 domain-containing protein [Anaerolineae bacterium]|jgi:uncharacterized protein YlxP (DUF503 family)